MLHPWSAQGLNIWCLRVGVHLVPRFLFNNIWRYSLKLEYYKDSVQKHTCRMAVPPHWNKLYIDLNKKVSTIIYLYIKLQVNKEVWVLTPTPSSGWISAILSGANWSLPSPTTLPMPHVAEWSVLVSVCRECLLYAVTQRSGFNTAEPSLFYSFPSFTATTAAFLHLREHAKACTFFGDASQNTSRWLC